MTHDTGMRLAAAIMHPCAVNPAAPSPFMKQFHGHIKFHGHAGFALVKRAGRVILKLAKWKSEINHRHLGQVMHAQIMHSVPFVAAQTPCRSMSLCLVSQEPISPHLIFSIGADLQLPVCFSATGAQGLLPPGVSQVIFTALSITLAQGKCRPSLGTPSMGNPQPHPLHYPTSQLTCLHQ